MGRGEATIKGVFHSLQHFLQKAGIGEWQSATTLRVVELNTHNIKGG